jgi:hypothetical protein
MPYDQTEEACALKPCLYGECPYYEGGEGIHGSIEPQLIGDKPLCRNCLIKPKDSPLANEPEKWRKI